MTPLNSVWAWATCLLGSAERLLNHLEKQGKHRQNEYHPAQVKEEIGIGGGAAGSTPPHAG